MRGRREERIEAAVDCLAAAALAAAVAFAGFVLLRGMLPQAQVGAISGACALSAFLLCLGVLRRIPERKSFELKVFEVPDMDFDDTGELLLTDQVELVLTDSDRLSPEQPAPPDELMLDDILAELGPDSRVVRLFDPAAMPTPGQLKSRIDRHLQGGPSISPAPDASEALYEALAELRRSLR